MRDVCVLGEVGATSTGYGSIPKIKIRFITQRVRSEVEGKTHALLDV